MKRTIYAILIIAGLSSFNSVCIGCNDTNKKEVVTVNESKTIPDGVYTGNLSKQDGTSAELKLTIKDAVIVSATLDGANYPSITTKKREYKDNLKDAVDYSQLKSKDYTCIKLIKIEGKTESTDNDSNSTYYIIFYEKELENGDCWYEM